MVTAASLDAMSLLGSLPIIGRIFPDPLASNGGAFLISLLFKTFYSNIEDEKERFDKKSGANSLRNSLDRLKDMNLTAIDKVLYTTIPSSSDVRPTTETSLAAVFFFCWMQGVLVWKHLLSFEKYASPILIVRYEDFMKNPGKIWSGVILPFCKLNMKDLDGDAPPALQKDSQQISLLSRKELKPHLGHFLPEDIQRMDSLIDAAGIASSLAEFRGIEVTED